MTSSRPCTLPGCDRPRYGHGYCRPHWRRWRKYGDPEADPHAHPATCNVPGCGGAYYARGYCRSCYNQWKRDGIPPEERYDTGPLDPRGRARILALARRHYSVVPAAHELGVTVRAIYDTVDAVPLFGDALDRALTREPEAWWHGTLTGYVNHKCRCPDSGPPTTRPVNTGHALDMRCVLTPALAIGVVVMVARRVSVDGGTELRSLGRMTGTPPWRPAVSEDRSNYDA